jgi:hypothetical protein
MIKYVDKTVDTNTIIVDELYGFITDNGKKTLIYGEELKRNLVKGNTDPRPVVHLKPDKPIVIEDREPIDMAAELNKQIDEEEKVKKARAKAKKQAKAEKPATTGGEVL